MTLKEFFQKYMYKKVKARRGTQRRDTEDLKSPKSNRD